MNSRRPPRFAVTLLKWFGLARNEAFAGDLIEEFQSGRTVGWFWRQTLTAIVAAMGKTTRRDDIRKLVAAYVIATSITVGLLEIHGPLFHHRVSWQSALSVTCLLFGLAKLTKAFRPAEYRDGLVKRSVALLVFNWAYIMPVALMGGDSCPPVIMFFSNVLGLVIDLRRAIKTRAPGNRGIAEE